MDATWEEVDVDGLRQGDLLPGCRVPVLPASLDDLDAIDDVVLERYDLIVLTQTCDLAQGRSELAALCPVFSLPSFERVNPEFAKRGNWENVRRGRVEGIHRLASPITPDDNRAALVVDFHEVYSLPIGYLDQLAAQLSPRWRLRSPFLEHFSQAFARFFMRVGLPTAIPPYK